MLSMSLKNQARFILNNKIAPGDLCRHVCDKIIKPLRPSDVTIEQVLSKSEASGVPVIEQIAEIGLRMAGYKKGAKRIQGMDDKDLRWHEFYNLDDDIKNELELIALKAENEQLKAENIRLNKKLEKLAGKRKLSG